MSGVSHSIDRFEVVFDEGSLVADAGLLAAGALLGRLGVEDAVNRSVRLGGRAGAAAPGRKVATLAAAMAVGGTHIDHVDRLRAGATGAVSGFAPAAPSTVGTFLRSFTWGHVRQLDRATGEILARAWRAGGGPGEAPVTVDVDSTVCGVAGKAKAGAAYGHTGQLGYHPLVATRAETGEVLHSRLRGGSSQRGGEHFVVEAVARARRAGAAGALTVRADSGFFSYDLLGRLDRLKVRWSVTIPLYSHVKAAIGAIGEDDWAPIAYTAAGEAAVAETTIVASGRGDKRELRLVVRRSRLTDQTQRELWPHWRYHAFTTDRADLDTAAADAYHRAHATVESAIRDLKQNAGLAHLPSGSFTANAAWPACAALTPGNPSCSPASTAGSPTGPPRAPTGSSKPSNAKDSATPTPRTTAGASCTAAHDTLTSPDNRTPAAPQNAESQKGRTNVR